MNWKYACLVLSVAALAVVAYEDCNEMVIAQRSSCTAFGDESEECGAVSASLAAQCGQSNAAETELLQTAAGRQGSARGRRYHETVAELQRSVGDIEHFDKKADDEAKDSAAARMQRRLHREEVRMQATDARVDKQIETANSEVQEANLGEQTKASLGEAAQRAQHKYDKKLVACKAMDDAVALTCNSFGDFSRTCGAVKKGRASHCASIKATISASPDVVALDAN